MADAAGGVVTSTDPNDSVTVADLRRMLDRHKKALCEGGRPDLAELAQVGIDAGRVFVTYPPPVLEYGPQSSAVLKALDIDPVFEFADSVASALAEPLGAKQ